MKLPEESKQILKEILLFAFSLYITSCLLFWLTDYLLGETKTEEAFWIRFDVKITIWRYFMFGMLFWVAWRVGDQMVKLDYFKLAVASIAVLFTSYHIGFICNWIDYYLIEGNPWKEQKMGLKELIGLFDGTTRSAPTYDLVLHFLMIFEDLRYANSRGFGYVLVFYDFVYGNLTMPLWISGIAYVLKIKSTSVTGKKIERIP